MYNIVILFYYNSDHDFQEFFKYDFHQISSKSTWGSILNHFMTRGHYLRTKL